MSTNAPLTLAGARAVVRVARGVGMTTEMSTTDKLLAAWLAEALEAAVPAPVQTQMFPKEVVR